jgi:hypothetical protein
VGEVGVGSSAAFEPIGVANPHFPHPAPTTILAP